MHYHRQRPEPTRDDVREEARINHRISIALAEPTVYWLADVYEELQKLVAALADHPDPDMRRRFAKAIDLRIATMFNRRSDIAERISEENNRGRISPWDDQSEGNA